MEGPSHGAEVLFLEKLQRLLNEGEFVATYKFAVLLGLTDIAVESWSAGTSYATDFTTSALAEKVTLLYWPQVQRIVPFRTGRPTILKQSRGKQAAIACHLSGLVERGAPQGVSGVLRLARQAPARKPGPEKRRTQAASRDRSVPRGRSLLDEIEWTLVRYPLPRLQRFPTGVDEFIYSIGWTVEDTERRESRLRSEWLEKKRHGHGGLPIRMKPGSTATLARFQGIVRDLIEARWVRMIRLMNPEVREEPDLHDYLFGPRRAALQAVRAPLLDIQQGLCFYCGSHTRQPDIDHFLPWALSRNDRIENLVAACGTCNARKKDHLAAERHIDRWLERLAPEGKLLGMMRLAAEEAQCPSGRDATLSLGQLLYRRPPAPDRLWLKEREFVTWDPARVRDRFVAASTQHCDRAAAEPHVPTP